jgi:hypothetical protein
MPSQNFRVTLSVNHEFSRREVSREDDDDNGKLTEGELKKLLSTKIAEMPAGSLSINVCDVEEYPEDE